MNLARVIGRVVSSHKDEGLSGRKLLVIQPLDETASDRGSPFVAVDAIGSGAAETVIYVRGREASHAFVPERVPTDASIVGIVDAATRRDGGAGRDPR
ncbi:MAG: EutN/CcmL family microcompartment protein [Acidobacteriota bacterium]